MDRSKPLQQDASLDQGFETLQPLDAWHNDFGRSYLGTVGVHDEITRLYGPWLNRTPADAVEVLNSYDGLWWVAGGWAIQAFTGTARHHGDLDLSIPRADVPSLRSHVAGRLDVWAADQGVLSPLVGAPGEPVAGTCVNLWLRRSGADPWEYDVILMDMLDGVWTYKRDARISRPVDEILWSIEGVRYLRPEVQLLHKAPGRRPKDEDDFDACLPLLDDGTRSWLAKALWTAHPRHPWINRLQALDHEVQTFDSKAGI